MVLVGVTREGEEAQREHARLDCQSSPKKYSQWATTALPMRSLKMIPVQGLNHYLRVDYFLSTLSASSFSGQFRFSLAN